MIGGGIVNDTKVPKNVSVLIGGNIVPGSAPRSYSYIDTTVPFYGTIYLPNDLIHIAGNDFTMFGAMVGKNITISGSNPAIHYDLTLRQPGIAGINAPFALVQLRELAPAEL
jgi:hypothetical protein